jgi:hypothetical protein
MGITSTVANYVTQGYPMRIWTQTCSYFPYSFNSINTILYSNQANPV